MAALGTSLQERLEEATAATGAVGATACVWLDGARHVAATGRTDHRTDEPVTVDTPLRLGSITKVATATLLTDLLAQDGRALDDRADELLPGCLPAPASTATWRHLLTHRSGIDGTFWDGFGDEPDAVARYAAETATLPCLFGPGQSWGYANSGYVLAGAAIERLSGRPFDEAVDHHLLQPLGIAGSTTMPSSGPPAGAANGHYLGADGVRPAEWPVGLRALGPAGATAFTTAADAITLADGLLADRWEALAASAKAMPPGGGTAATHQALGWRVFHWDDAVLFGHDGGATGMGSFLRWEPRRRVGIAVLVNTVPSALLLWTELSSWFFDEVGITVPPALTGTADATVEPEWVGEYRCRDATFLVEPGTDDRSTLALRIDGLGGALHRSAALEPLGPGVYRSDAYLTDPTRVVSFERFDDGARLVHCGPFTARNAHGPSAGSWQAAAPAPGTERATTREVDA